VGGRISARGSPVKVLVTGLHRSGTSVAAKMLAHVSRLGLNDDPEWAIFHPLMARAYRDVLQYRAELESSEIVKCPRMGECLTEALTDFPITKAVFVVRDPRDVYCSVREAVEAGHWTAATMADNARFGRHETLWQGVALAFRMYALEALAARRAHGERVIFSRYADLYRGLQCEISALCGALSVRELRPIPPGAERAQLAPLRNKSTYDTSIKGVDRWQEELTREVAETIEVLCGEPFRTLETLAVSGPHQEKY
jgi:hypothetical protein